jgi:thymidylate kinase
MPDAARPLATRPRLIFVDGLPGSGKSTTAQRLCFHLQRLGRPARWYFEHEQGHPIFDDEQVRCARATGPAEPNGIRARALAGYAMLAARLADETAPTMILESTLFQTAVGTQLLMDLPAAEIERHFQRTMELLAPVAPALIVFRPPDVAAALRRAAEKRGAWFPEFLVAHLGDTPRGRRTRLADFAGVIAFFEDYRAQCDALFARFAGPRLAVDNSAGDWPRHTRDLTDFLGLPPMAGPPVPAGLAELAGRYRAADGDEWNVAADAHGLFFDDAARGRIVPRPGGGFAIEGVCIELDFERDAAGRVRRIRCAGALPGLATEWEKTL